jgi:hypothetical protein
MPASAEATFTMPFTSDGFREGTRADYVQRQFNVIDTFSLTAGVHQLKFGVDLRRLNPTNSAINYLSEFINPPRWRLLAPALMRQACEGAPESRLN